MVNKLIENESYLETNNKNTIHITLGNIIPTWSDKNKFSLLRFVKRVPDNHLMIERDTVIQNIRERASVIAL